MEKYAPIIIPTLCRYDKLKVLVDSLANNVEYAKQTELVIGLDYPPAEKYVEGHNIIKTYLPTIRGFGKVTIIEQSENLGTVGNEKFLLDYIYAEGYDRFIFSEDDNEVSPNFLEYMNKGLEKYEADPCVYSISGYNFPIDMGGYDKNVYGSFRFSAWGCGFWKKKRLVFTRKELVKFLLVPTHFFKILIKIPFKFLSVPVMLSRHELYGDSCHELYCCVNNWVSIYPSVSKVRNWGRDGSGLHGQTDENDPCYNQAIDEAVTFEYDEIEIKDLRLKSLDKYFSNIYSSTIKRNIKKLIGR